MSWWWRVVVESWEGECVRAFDLDDTHYSISFVCRMRRHWTAIANASSIATKKAYT